MKVGDRVKFVKLNGKFRHHIELINRTGTVTQYDGDKHPGTICTLVELDSGSGSMWAYESELELINGEEKPN